MPNQSSRDREPGATLTRTTIILPLDARHQGALFRRQFMGCPSSLRRRL